MFLGKFQSLLCFLEQIVVPNDTFSWRESFFLSQGGKPFFAPPTFPMDKPTFPPLPAERHRAQVSGFVHGSRIGCQNGGANSDFLHSSERMVPFPETILREKMSFSAKVSTTKKRKKVDFLTYTHTGKNVEKSTFISAEFSRNFKPWVRIV